MRIFYKTARDFFFTSVIFSFALFLRLAIKEQKKKCGERKSYIIRRKSRSEKVSCSLLMFVFVCFTLITGQQGFAEERTERYRLINFDLLGAVFGMARVEYQQNINGKSAWAVRGIFWRSNTESWKWDTYGGGFSYRRYFTHTAPEGGWFGGGMDVLYANARYMGKEDNGYFVFPHAEAGYTFSFSPRSRPLEGGDKKGGWLVTPSVSLGNYIGNIEISDSNIPISGAGMRLSVLLSYPF